MLLALTAALIAAGAVAGVIGLVLLGALAVSFLPIILLAPAFRIASERSAKSRYNDDSIGGALTLLGFKPSEQRSAPSGRRGGQTP